MQWIFLCRWNLSIILRSLAQIGNTVPAHLQWSLCCLICHEIKVSPPTFVVFLGRAAFIFIIFEMTMWSIHIYEYMTLKGKSDQNLTWHQQKPGILFKKKISQNRRNNHISSRQAMQIHIVKAKTEHISKGRRCWLCKFQMETVDHLISGCSQIAPPENIRNAIELQKVCTEIYEESLALLLAKLLRSHTLKNNNNNKNLREWGWEDVGF